MLYENSWPKRETKEHKEGVGGEGAGEIQRREERKIAPGVLKAMEDTN